jgi:hypothetical protein
MTEADLSNKHLGVGGAITVVAWISHKDKGALTSLDLSSKLSGARMAFGMCQSRHSHVCPPIIGIHPKLVFN